MYEQKLPARRLSSRVPTAFLQTRKGGKQTMQKDYIPHTQENPPEREKKRGEHL